MSTALATREVGVVGRVAALRQTSPGRLQLWLGVLVALGLLTGLAAGLTGYHARSGTNDLGNRAQPLLVEAETIYSNLADADTTAARAFLAGGLEPAALTDRYNQDLDRATAALASAARLTDDGSEAATAVSTLSSGVARYAALVATARADNRQGLPVGSSYLSAASTLNRDTLLKQSQELFRLAQAEVEDGYGTARGIAWWVVFILVLAALVVALIAAQRYLSRSTHRTFNVPLAAATVLTALLGIGSLSVLISQNAHLGKAGDDGSTPVAQLAEARILALRERGDEALALAAHGSGSAYESDFQAAQQILSPADGPLRYAAGAAAAHQKYLAIHTKVRALDDGGDYDGAVALAVQDGTSQTFDSFTGDLGDALDLHKRTFTSEIDNAGRGLGALTVLGPIVALVVCALAFLGVRTRLEEYR